MVKYWSRLYQEIVKVGEMWPSGGSVVLAQAPFPYLRREGSYGSVPGGPDSGFFSWSNKEWID
jgi:hypothetical protein